MDVVLTGSWSRKSAGEARRYADVHRGRCGRHRPHPHAMGPAPDAAYVHVCTNETIDGLEFHELPVVPNGVPW